MLAVIKTGGKQYLVSPGQKIKIDPPAMFRVAMRAGKKEGQEVIFDEVLLLQKGNKLEIGAPLVKGAKVTGKIISHGKAKKVIIFKYKAKKRYKKKLGYRQPYTEAEITAIKK